MSQVYASGVSEVYTPPYRPRVKQQEALDKCDGQEAFALLMKMRTGKTKVTLDDFGRLELAGKCQDLAVIAPGGVYRTWVEACNEHLSLDLKARVSVFIWESGGSAAYIRRLYTFLNNDQNRPRIFLMNVEALSSVKEARTAILAFFDAAQRRAMLAIDEATIIKNPSAKRTRFINGTLSRLADYRRILSGLIAPRSPLDVYAPFEFLDWRILGFRSFYAFRARYAVLRPEWFGGRQVQIVCGYRNVDDLANRIAAQSFQCSLEDCYDLPPKIYTRREVTLTPEQRRLYKDMRDFATAQLDATSHVTATIVIAQMIRMHQILCGYTVDEMGQVHLIPEKRTDELIELFNETEGKAIVWCSYDHNVRHVSARLAQEFGANSVARFWGGNASGREAEEKRFKVDSSCRFMVATAAAGGRGREWSVADLVVYYSNSDNLEHRSQSEERPQAVGKAQSVLYVDLVAPGTVDEKIIRALREKINLSAAVTGENYRQWLI